MVGRILKINPSRNMIAVISAESEILIFEGYSTEFEVGDTLSWDENEDVLQNTTSGKSISVILQENGVLLSNLDKRLLF